MAKAKTVQKAQINPTSGVTTSNGALHPVSVAAPSTADLKPFERRLEAMEAAVDSLVRDISKLKQVPSELVTHQSTMDRLEEKIDSTNAALKSYMAELAKPKKRWGIF